MAELNIKHEIGRRILEARKAKGLTLKALGELAGGLKQTRLTNWEQGTRAPGPEEIKLLAKALDVSPAYLMCLSDEQQIKKTKSHRHLIPLLNHHQACDAKSHIEAICARDTSTEIECISVDASLFPKLSKQTFALKMIDESMLPEIRVGDALIVNTSIKPKPGDFVVALIEDEQEVIVRKYKQVSATKEDSLYELIALNGDWANIRVGSNEIQAHIIGCGVSLIRELRG